MNAIKETRSPAHRTSPPWPNGTLRPCRSTSILHTAEIERQLEMMRFAHCMWFLGRAFQGCVEFIRKEAAWASLRLEGRRPALGEGGQLTRCKLGLQ